MTRELIWLLVALAVSPAAAYGIYRLAKELGFLDPPFNQQHEYRRSITVALYCFLLLLPPLLFGSERGWPRIWLLFLLINVLALAFFGAAGVVSVLRLWKLRHPPAAAPETIPIPEAPPVDLPLDSDRDPEEPL